MLLKIQEPVPGDLLHLILYTNSDLSIKKLSVNRYLSVKSEKECS